MCSSWTGTTVWGCASLMLGITCHFNHTWIFTQNSERRNRRTVVSQTGKVEKIWIRGGWRRPGNTKGKNDCMKQKKEIATASKTRRHSQSQRLQEGVSDTGSFCDVVLCGLKLSKQLNVCKPKFFNIHDVKSWWRWALSCSSLFPCFTKSTRCFVLGILWPSAGFDTVRIFVSEKARVLCSNFDAAQIVFGYS